MMYRLLTDEEITLLEDHGCQAENWEAIMVAEDFKPTYVHDVTFYGDIKLGVFEKNIEVSRGFLKHSGLRNATLRNVCIGDNSLVENIGNYINNYSIGEECYISNVSTMETTEGATYGEGNLISVLNEVGEGNVTLFDGLNSQLAAFMVKHNVDKELRERIRQMIAEELERTLPDRGTIGFGVKIVNTREVVNTIVQDNCEVNGAARLFDCSLLSAAGSGVYVGSGVIFENSIVADGSSITNDCNLQDCYVGEACQLTNGFTASASVFFANSYMSNGEACAAFCGPFTASHHKSSLLIGAMFSFYNAGSATNFSNHAYKMGPMHYGILERGTKTASGAYILMPANIGAFSVCFGKLMHHPDTRNIPFSYLIAYGDIMYLVPGRNLNTVGLYRDVRKWPKRDIRPRSGQKSIVNFTWLSPFTVNEMLQGKQILEKLREAQGEMVPEYNFRGYVITNNSLNIGLRNYDMAIKMFLARCVRKYGPTEPASTTGWKQWSDLSGLLLPESEELRLIEEIKNREITDIQRVTERFGEIGERYEQYEWAFAYRLINEYYGIAQPRHADWQDIIDQGREAKRQWIATIREDALKEYKLGDVEEDVYRGFVEQLNKETE
jgi:hypothetical protein